MRRLTVLPAILCLLMAGHASAGEMLDEAVRSLRVDPVYVHPQADPTLDAEAAQRLRDQISVSAAPVFIAVLPSWAADEAGGVDALPRAIGVALDRTGAVAVIAGRSFRAGASAGVGLDGGQAGHLATQSFEAFHPAEHGLEPMLADFVGRVQTAGAGPAPVAPPDVVRRVPDAGLEPMPWRSVPDSSPMPGFGLIFGLILTVGIVSAIAKAMGSGDGWSSSGSFSSSLTPLDDDDHHRRRRSGWPFGNSSTGGSIFGSSGSSRSGDWGSSSRGGSGDWGGSSGGSSSGSSGSSSGGSKSSGGGDW